MTKAPLKRINNGCVIGSGWRVDVPDIHTVRYSEGESVVNLEIEGPSDLADPWYLYWPQVFGWDEADRDPIHDDRKLKEIRARISAALDALGIKHEVQVI